MLAVWLMCCCAPRTILSPRADLMCFVNTTDPDADVFSGLVSLQVYVRARMLTRIGAAVPSLTPRTLRDVVLPLVLQLMQDAVKDPGARDRKYSRGASTGSEGNVSHLHGEAVMVVGAIAARLPWGQYLSVLRGLVVEVCAPLPLTLAVAVSILFESAAGGCSRHIAL